MIKKLCVSAYDVSVRDVGVHYTVSLIHLKESVALLIVIADFQLSGEHCCLGLSEMWSELLVLLKGKSVRFVEDIILKFASSGFQKSWYPELSLTVQVVVVAYEFEEIQMKLIFVSL